MLLVAVVVVLLLLLLLSLARRGGGCVNGFRGCDGVGAVAADGGRGRSWCCR